MANYNYSRMDGIVGGSCHKYHFACIKHISFLSRQTRILKSSVTTKFCRDKLTFVMTKFCRDKLTFVMTKFCRDKLTFVSTKTCLS